MPLVGKLLFCTKKYQDSLGKWQVPALGQEVQKTHTHVQPLWPGQAQLGRGCQGMGAGGRAWRAYTAIVPCAGTLTLNAAPQDPGCPAHCPLLCRAGPGVPLPLNLCPLWPIPILFKLHFQPGGSIQYSWGSRGSRVRVSVWGADSRRRVGDLRSNLCLRLPAPSSAGKEEGQSGTGCSPRWPPSPLRT